MKKKGIKISWNFVFVLFLAVIIIIDFPYASSDVGEDLTITFQEPKICNLSQNETFSWATLGCVKCQRKRENSPDYCSCPPKFLATNVSSSGGEKCSKCPNNTILYDKKHCVRCGELNSYNALTESCQPCPSGHIEVAYNNDGSPKEVLECVKCTEGYHPSLLLEIQKCIPCHPSFFFGVNGTCRCPEVSHTIFGGVCFSNSELSDPTFDRKTAYKIEYDHQKLESPLLRDHLVAAFYLCKGKQNQTACQMLGNMCTLNLHSYGEEWTACKLYRAALTGPVSHPPNYVPKIYYSDVEAPSVLIRSSTIPHVHNTDYSSTSSDVNITLAKFSFTGEFLGLAELEDIIPCRESKLVLQAGRKFGTTFKASCSITIQNLWNKFKDKMMFLDPYVSYDLDGHGRQLYAIPIKIQNFKRHGTKLNSLEDKYQWQLVRRFFLIDTIGPVETDKEKEEQQTTPKVIRYLKSLHVSVQLQNSQEAGKIYIPLLTLTYADMNHEDFIRNEIVEFEYTVQYFMDMSRSIEDVKISVGVLSALAVLWSAIQAWSLNRRSGQVQMDHLLTNLLITSCGNLADAFFVVCFSTVLFWFIFFKKQVAVHVFLPDIYQERLIRDLLISAFSLKIVEIIDLIRRQSSVDIFFVDWERPKIRNTIHQTNLPKSSNDNIRNEINADKSANEESVSIWRTYFIANEWNEIQTTRKVHMAFQIIASIFFLEVLGFKFWGLHWPNGNLSPDPHIVEHIPYSTSARFVVASLVFGLIGIMQWIYRIGIYERYIENEIQDFVDLCTMGNISVFILAERQHGYYIHGRSVHGFADTDMQTMIEQLQREEEDLCGRRGLLPQTDQQTFLISVPNSFRSVYNQVLQPLYATSASNSAFFAKRQVAGGKLPGGGSKPTANMLSLSIHAYHSMNRFLTAFLEHALSDLDYDVMKKTFFEATFDMEFNEVGNDRAVFYTDEGHSFDSVLFYGHERTLFMFNLYTFIFVDIFSHNYVLAGIVVFVLDLMLKTLRNFLGKRNLARKTLIDSRFLI